MRLDLKHPSWIGQQKVVTLHKGGCTILYTTSIVRHVRWLVHLTRYYHWWAKQGHAGSTHFHHLDDVKFFKDLWKGLI